MVIKVIALGIVLVAHVDDDRSDVSKVFFSWFAADNRHGVRVNQNAAGEKIVFVGAARVGQNLLDAHRLVSLFSHTIACASPRFLNDEASLGV